MMRNIWIGLLLLCLAGVYSSQDVSADDSENAGGPVLDYAEPNEEDYDTNFDDEQQSNDSVTKFPRFLPTQTNITIKENQPLKLNCETDGQYNDFVLLLRTNNIILYVGSNKALQDSKFEIDYDKHQNMTFVLDKANRRDAGTYECFFQTTPPVSKKYYVNVLFPPTIRGKRRHQKVTKVTKDQGESVTFNCNIGGNPTPTITWSKQNGRLPDDMKHEDGQQLTLQHVNKHSQGSYKCTANNGIGEEAFHIFKLSVNYLPEISTEKKIVRNDKSGDTVTLICIVHSHHPVTVTWSKDNEPLAVESGDEEGHKGHRYFIKLHDVSQENFGAYKCRARNNKGEASKILNLTAGPTTPFFKSDKSSSEESTYTLEWTTESFYPISQFKIKYRQLLEGNGSAEWKEFSKEIEDSAPNNILIHEMSHHLTDLVPDTTYEVSVSVTNTEGMGSESFFEFSTSKENGTASPMSSAPRSTALNFIILVCSVLVFMES